MVWECLIHPSQSSADMSYSIHCIQKAHLIMWMVVIHLPPSQGKQLFSGVKELCKVGRKMTSSLDGFWTTLWGHGLGEKPYCHIWLWMFASCVSFPLLGQAFHTGHPEMRWDVLYGPVTSVWNSGPSEDIAHIVLLAPLWSWTSTVALCPTIR